MVTKRIVCLAKSNRDGGFCVAGKELAYGRVGQWIRPIGASDNEAVDPDTCQLVDGTELALLDIVELRLRRRVPSGHHAEDWLFDDSVTWRRVGKFNRHHIGTLVDAEDSTLWGVGCSTSTGRNDCVSEDDIPDMTDSLRLVRVDELTVVVDDYPSESGTRRRVQGRFNLGWNDYAMWIKDAKCESFYENSLPVETTFKNRYLSVSLTKDFEGRCYKLIAGII